MKLSLRTLDGYDLKHKIVSSVLGNTSTLHSNTRELLKAEFPFLVIMEEVSIPIFKKQLVKFDFFIPQKSLFIEVQGEQHFKYTPHYHKNKIGFLKAVTRDTNKKAWCLLNNYNLIEFLWNEDIETWKNKLY